MNITILDCYTDEASGLGVPPYLGTYPRYILGMYENAKYITIDDLRLWKKHKGVVQEVKPHQKTDISTYNLTIHHKNIGEIIEKTKKLIVILGVHVPGKYLTANPGTLKEVIPLIKDFKGERILTGPAVLGTQLFGGKAAEKFDTSQFHKIDYSLFNQMNV